MFEMFHSLKILFVIIFVFRVDGDPGTEEEKKTLQTNIMAGIKNGSHELADENVLKLGVDSFGLNLIVHYIYAQNISNFRILHDYAANSNNSKIRYHVLRQLWRELQNDIHLVPVNEFCDIYETLKQRVINQTDLDYDYIDYANIMIKDISVKIVKFTVHHLNAYLSRNAYELVQGLANRVYQLSESLFNQIICKVINDCYNSLRFRDLVKAMWSNTFIRQKATALSCILQNLYKNIGGNPQASMLIGYYYYKLKNLKDYSQFDEYEVIKIDINIQHLPPLVQRLYFEDNICIRNVKSQSYIAPDFRTDSDQLSVYSLSGGKLRRFAIWGIEPVDEYHFKIINKYFVNHYLYADDNARNERSVNIRKFEPLTEKINKRSTWRITLHNQFYNDDLAFENLRNNELLCLGDRTFSGPENQIYQNTITSEEDLGDGKCRWIVDACPNWQSAEN